MKARQIVFSYTLQDDDTQEDIDYIVNDIYRSVKYSDGPAQNIYFEGVREVEVPSWEVGEE
jgi:hypothetical protein